MAELRDQLVLDIDSALRSVDELGDSINRTLSQVRDVQIDDSSFRTVDERLDSIEKNTSEVASDLSEMELAARRSSANFTDLARALGVSEDEARRLSEEVLEAANSARRLETEAEGVARQLGLSESQARDFVQQLSRGPRQVQEIDNRLDRVNQGLARFRTLAIGALAAFGVRGLVNAAGSAIDSFNLLNESVNAVNVTFEEGADIVFEFGEQSARSAGLARGSFQQLVVPVGALLRNFGFDADQAATAAVRLTQRAADLASVFNTEVSEALTAIQAALRGESDPIERFGAGISAARVEALALSEGLAETRAELTDLDKVQARYLLILQDTAKVQGDFLATADSPANAARVLAEQAEEASAALGEALIPAYLEILRVAPEVIESFEEVGPAIETMALAITSNADQIADSVLSAIEVLSRLGISAEIVFLSAQRAFQILTGSDIEFVTRLNEATGELEVVAEGLDRAAEATERIDALYRQLDLVTSIQNGVDPLEALGAVVRAVATEGGNLEQEFADLARISGLSGQELARAIELFLAKGPNMRLFGDDVEFLREQLGFLRSEAQFPGDGIFGVGFAIPPALEDLPTVIDDGIVSLSELRAVAAEAGVSISEAFGSDLFAEGTTFSGLAEVEAQVEGFRDRINAIGPTINPLEGAAEAVDLSITEFLENITAQFEQSAEFELALSQLAAQGFDALADSLRGLGPGALGLVEDFLEDTASAEVAEDIFDPAANDFADKLESTFRGSVTAIEWAELVGDAEAGIVAAFTRTNFSRLGEEEVRNIARGLEAPPGLTEAAFSGASVAEEVAGGFSTFFSQNASDLSLEAVQDISTGLVDSSAIQEAIDSGRALAEAVNQGFVDNLQFDFNIPVPTAAPTRTEGDRTPQTAPTGVVIEQTINTTPEREQTDVARSTQLAGATARNIR